MKISCNGDSLAIAAESTVQDAVSVYLNATASAAPAGLALACNGEVVPRHQWPHRLLAEGDRLDVFTAVAGG